MLCVAGLFASFGCSSDSSSANHKDGGSNQSTTADGGASNSGKANGGASNGGKANGGASNGASANGSSGGNAANGGSLGSASGGAANAGSANAANGGTANAGGNANGGTANGGTANGGRTNSAGANSGGRNAGSGGASNGGAASGDSGAPMLIDQYVTFYGWPDNDPAGNGIAYPGLHQGASGTGTYADPITFATDPKEWKPGTILYLPYLERYVIMEDSCAECIQDWKTGKYHIDIWLESNGSFDSQVLACENTLTREKTSVEVDPPPDRPVDATPLFDTKTGTCNPP